MENIGKSGTADTLGFFGSKKAATYLDTTEKNLAQLRYLKRGPKFFKLGRKPLYRQVDLDRWAMANPVQTVDSHNLESV